MLPMGFLKNVKLFGSAVWPAILIANICLIIYTSEELYYTDY